MLYTHLYNKYTLNLVTILIFLRVYLWFVVTYFMKWIDAQGKSERASEREQAKRKTSIVS